MLLEVGGSIPTGIFSPGSSDKNLKETIEINFPTSIVFLNSTTFGIRSPLPVAK